MLRTGGTALALCVLFRRVARVLGLLTTGLDVTVLAIGAALILLSIGANTGRRFLQPVQWFGRNSYEVYLTHMFVVTTAAQLFVRLGSPLNYVPVWFVSTLVLSGLLGQAVAKLYSSPCNRALTRG